MATTKSISSNATKNNSGVSVYVGTSSVLGTLNLGLRSPATGSVVVDGADTDKVITGNTFAKNTQRPVGKRLKEAAALESGSSYPVYVRSVNGIETVDTRAVATAIRSGYWNIYTGKWSTDPVVSYDNMHKAVVGTTNIDDAVHVSRANPGSLTFMSGNKNPVNKNYDSKRG